MNQDISIRKMILSIKYEDQIPEEYHFFVKKYLSLMWGVGFDSGRSDVLATLAGKSTAVILRDTNGTRIAQYKTVKEVSIATNTPYRTVFDHMKTHKKTKAGYYFERVN